MERGEPSNTDRALPGYLTRSHLPLWVLLANKELRKGGGDSEREKCTRLQPSQRQPPQTSQTPFVRPPHSSHTTHPATSRMGPGQGKAGGSPFFPCSLQGTGRLGCCKARVPLAVWRWERRGRGADSSCRRLRRRQHPRPQTAQGAKVATSGQGGRGGRRKRARRPPCPVLLQLSCFLQLCRGYSFRPSFLVFFAASTRSNSRSEVAPPALQRQLASRAGPGE